MSERAPQTTFNQLQPAVDAAREGGQTADDMYGKVTPNRGYGRTEMIGSQTTGEPLLQVNRDAIGGQTFKAEVAMPIANGGSAEASTHVVVDRFDDSERTTATINRYNAAGEVVHKFESKNPNTARRIGNYVASKVVEQAAERSADKAA